MTNAANNYGTPNWTSSGGHGPWSHFGNQWGNRPWGMMPPWMPPYAAKPLLIAAMILGFVFWWPVGLVLLGVLLWNKRMIC
ncbi:MAG TPA: DUF2852 domain-containing protein, partial [Xanthobacteraceae bacterium]|nr:DUF2852 domain-containing protein [Xanthobacteraceae bacterium]